MFYLLKNILLNNKIILLKPLYIHWCNKNGRDWFQQSISKRSLINCVGCVVTWVTWVRGLRGSNFYVGCVGDVGLNIFYVGHNFYVGCMGQIHFCVGQNFLRESIFLCASRFFVWVKIFYQASKFLRGSNFLRWI